MGTISDKLTYLNTTKSNIKDAINLTGANILSEDTFRSYANKLKQGLVDAINDGGSTIYSNFPKTTGEGTEITLNNTYAAPMGTILKGNTEQTTYSGKNFFDKTITKSQGDGRIGDTALETGKKLTWNGASATTGYMWLGYVIKDVTNYVGKIVRFKTNFSASASNTPQYAIGICDSDGDNRTSKASSSTSGNTISFTIPSLSGTQTYLYVLLYANSGGTLNPNDYVDYTDMILTIDKSDMTYEPFVGGSPSPSPDYPQDVRVVTGNNTINVCGKNLIDFSNATPTGDSTTYTFENDIIEVTNTNTRTYCGVTWDITSLMQRNPSKVLKFAYESFDGSNAGGVSTTQIAQLKIINSGTTSYKGLLNRAGTENTYEIPSDTSGITLAQLFIYSNNTNTPENHSVSITKPMLIFSTDTTAYEPYVTPQEYPLNLGSMELCKIPNTNYQDIIFHAINGDSFYDTLDNATKQTLTYGKWYKHSEIGKIVLDGSETTWSDVQLASGYYRAYNIVSDILNLGNYRQTDIFCNNFNVTATNGYSIIFHYGNQLYYYMPSDITTKSQFTTLLSQNNSIVYYVLATPTNTEITDTDLISQLETIRTAKSVENKTIISQTNADLPFIISASALSKN